MLISLSQSQDKKVENGSKWFMRPVKQHEAIISLDCGVILVHSRADFCVQPTHVIRCFTERQWV